jgi:group I intron endonuclease
MVEVIDYVSSVFPNVKQILLHCNSQKEKSGADIEIWCGDIQEGDKFGLAPTATTTALLCMLDVLAVELSHRIGFGALDFFKFHPGGSLGASFTKVGFIYKTTNLINGKFYVGQCSNDPRGKYLGSGKILLEAIEKYGKENFRREILQFAEQDDLNDLERIWIKKLRAQELGYNILPGGSGGWRASNAKPNGMLGKKHSPETKTKMSEKKKAYLQDIGTHPRTGQKHSDDTKRRLSELRKNVQPSNVRRLIGPDGTTYRNITEAKEKTNLGFRIIEKLLKDPGSGWKVQT